MGVEQKVAVITDASQGIGAALVKVYRDRYHRVVATAHSQFIAVFYSKTTEPAGTPTP